MPADVGYQRVIPEDSENRKFVLVSSSGTTNTVPPIYEDNVAFEDYVPDWGDYYFGGYHHEAIGIRGGPEPMPRTSTLPTMHLIARYPGDNFPEGTDPGHPTNPRHFDAPPMRQESRNHPFRFPHMGNPGDNVSIEVLYYC
jgi:hypothetical protein